MTTTDAIDRARESFARQAWGEAYSLLSEPAVVGSLQLADLERLAIAAHMLGR